MKLELYRNFYQFLAKYYHTEQLTNIPDNPEKTALTAVNLLTSYCESWAGKSLSYRLDEAKDFRQKGSFNAAMAAVANIVKEHVEAIRKIQSFFDELVGRKKTSVDFSKFKQTIPLEVGIDNGPDVLECIKVYLEPWKTEHGMNFHYLMESEKKYYFEQQKLQVLERFYAEKTEAKELKEQAAELEKTREDLIELKRELGIGLLELGYRVLKEKGNRSLVDLDFAEQLLRVLLPLTAVTLSAVLTKAGSEVDVDDSSEC
jgi:hypothetical protein